MESVITIINIIVLTGANIYFFERNHKAEIARYREFVKSMLVDDVGTYNEMMDEPGEPPVPEDEIIELDQVDDQQLIKKLNEDYENR